MSKFIPNQEQKQEEVLQPIFERNQIYKTVKDDSRRNFLLTHYPKPGFLSTLLGFIDSNRMVLIGGFATTIVVAGLVTALIFNFQNGKFNPITILSGIPVSAEEVKITANDKSTLGVNSNSSYTLNFTKDVEKTDVEKNLIVTPNLPYKLEQKSRQQYELTFDSALDAKQIVKFELKTNPKKLKEDPKNILSWAFQVKDSFRIINTLPRDKSTGVATNSGIEINFNTTKFQDPRSLISISPQVEGEFKRNGATQIFVPKSLKPSTLYTVSLKSGLGLDGGNEKLDKDFSFQFETALDSKFNNDYTQFNQNFYEFTSSTKPAFELAGAEKLTDVQVDVFAFSNIDDFENKLTQKYFVPSWALYSQNQAQIDTANLTKVQSGKFTLADSSNYLKYFSLPKTLDLGYYLVETTVNNNKTQTYFQVSNFAASINEYKDKSLAWVIDLVNKKPLANVQISAKNQNVSAITSDQGLATFNTPGQSYDKTFFYRVQSGDKIMLLPHQTGTNDYYIAEYYDKNVQDDYWSYIYTDKTLYQPDEGVNLWGFVKPRKDASIDNLKVVLSTYYFDQKSQSGQDQEVLSQKLDLQGNQFTSKLNLKNLAPADYTLSVVDKNGRTIVSRGLSVQNYVKPSYNIEVKSDKTAYFAGENINYTGSVKFYDGTPVPNVELKPNGIKTDAQGNFKYSQKLENNSIDPSGNGKKNFATTFTPKNSEQGIIETELNNVFFDYKNNLNIKTNVKNKKGTIDLQLNQIDLTRLNNETSKDSEDFLGSPIQNQKIDVLAQEYIYEQLETGTVYNLLTKKTEKTYSTGGKKILSSQNFTANTDSTGKAKIEFPTKLNSSYTLTISTSDGEGKNMSFSRDLYPEYNELNPDNNPNLSIDTSVSKNSTYNIGESITGSYNINNNPITTDGNSYFVTILDQNGLKDVKFSTDSKLNLTFDESFVPNTTISGLVFTNGNIYSVYAQNLKFNYDNKKVILDIVYDKESYRPGENVNLKVQAKDADSKPIATSVNVAGVDTAIYSISQNPVNPLDSIYKYLGSTLGYSYTSHQFTIKATGVGTGGGGRQNFTDTAVFKTITTDSNGEGSLSFKLPDNITSYKLVAQTITNDLKAGDTEKSLPVSLPYFVDAVLNTTYLKGDKPVIKIRSFGKDTKIGEPVSYSVSSETLGLGEQAINSKIGDSAELSLNDLPSGDQKITIKGTYGNLTDSITRSFAVKDSYSKKEQISNLDYSVDKPLTGSPDGSTTIVITDKNRGKFYTNLTQLASIDGDRSDQLFAKNKSFDLLKTYFNEHNLPNDFKLRDYQTDTGGIGIYKYAPDDLWLSSLTADLKDGSINNDKLKTYFNSVLTDSKESRERQLQALFGLASLGEPVLNTLQNISTDPNLTPKENLYLAFGLIVSGDKESARAIFKQLSANIKTTDNQSSFDYGQAKDKVAEDTVLLAVLASIINEKSAPSLFESVESLPQETPMYLEQVIFLTNWLPNQNPSKVEFSYNLNDQNIVKKLDSGEIFSLTLNPDQLKNLSLKVTSGEINITTKYAIAITTKNLQSKELEVTRSYSIVGETREDIRDGDLVKVNLKYSIKKTTYKGCYNLTDYLPSGLKPETSAQAFNFIDIGNVNITSPLYPYKIDQQSVSFYANVDDVMRNRNDIFYLARVVNKGIFTADRAILQSYQNPSLYSTTDSQKIEIK